MNLFEYLGVLVSVVIGLAVTYLVNGVVDVIQRRGVAKVYWVHLAWVFFLLTWLVQFWWSFFAWSQAEWSLELFMFFLAYAVTLSVVAGLLFERESLTADFRELFFKHSTWFFALQILANGLDVIEVNMKARAGIRAVPAGYHVALAAMVLGLVVGMLSQNAKYHGALAVFAVVWALGYGVGVF